MRWQLTQVASHMGGKLHGEDAAFDVVCTDTRKLAVGDLFFALKGPNFDAHDFVEQAASLGAIAAVVERKLDVPLPQIIVKDALRALGQFAAWWRGQFDIPVIGITGSSGKTTIKNLTASILSCKGETLATDGNFNNEVGVPLTLFRLEEKHHAAVIEMGASKAGDIDRLCEIASPNVSVVGNVGPAHLTGFGSVEGVARAKGEIYAHLPEDGVAVINNDEAFVDLWKELAGKHRIVTFGYSDAADFYIDRDAIRNGGLMSRFELHTPDGDIAVELPLPGMHNVSNALAAAALAGAAGCGLSEIQQGLKSARGASGRMQIIEMRNGVKIIDDTYNANPLSLKAAMTWLSSLGGTAWLVLGDMRELGSDAAHLHHKAGLDARKLGVKKLFTLGEMSREASGAFGLGARHFESIDALGNALTNEVEPGVTVLIKGSRSMQMERIVEQLMASGNREV